MTGTENGTDAPAGDFFEYVLPGGWEVRAGRTDADNEILSLEVAQPEDWWFHVRGLPGSHVLLRARPGEEPDRRTLERAAAIAAHHSKARGAGVVPVSCTRAANVRPARGERRGTVEIRRETILKVRPGLDEAIRTGRGGRKS